MPPYLRETTLNFPEVENSIRFFFWYEPTVRYEEEVFTVRDFALVDSTVFNVFDFDFISGNPSKALNNPYSLVLTKTTSSKLFGEKEALGKTVILDNQFNYTVTGVVQDIKDFHMDINAFASITDITARNENSTFLTSRNHNHSIYLRINSKTNISDLEEKINAQARESDQYGGSTLLLRQFSDIYFAKNLNHEKNTKHGNWDLLVAFTLIGIFVLVIACVNFINLTIAQTGNRRKEIAVRKVSGAKQRSIQLQFFGETLIIVFIALILALNIINLLLPSFRLLTGEQITLDNFRVIWIIGPVLLLTILISGAYPSYYLSKINTTQIFKVADGKGGKIGLLSKTLITFQYSVSIFLIIATITVIRQSEFMKNSNLGIDHEHVLAVRLRGDRFDGDSLKILGAKKAFEQQLSGIPTFKGVTFLNQLPGKITNTYSMVMTAGENALQDTIPVKVINADPNFISMMDIEMIEGRNLSFDLETDLGRKFVLNQEAVRQFGMTKPLESELWDREIVGVVKDFHYNSLHSKIEPVAIVWDFWTGRACIKLDGVDLENSIAAVKEVYNEFCPGYGFEYEFLDESFATQYKSEERLQSLLLNFVALAIVLSCLGLFALTALISKQKTKEIGIRKVLGSTNRALVLLLANNFTRYIIMANLISWPLGYIVLTGWLQTFEYRVSLNATIFLLSGGIVFLIAFFNDRIPSTKIRTHKSC